MRVILVHGWNVNDGGRGTVDRLRPWFEARNYVVSDFDYGWRFLLRTRDWGGKLATQLADMTEPGDIAVGHSNGCTLIHDAAHRGARFSKVIYLNPALNRDAVLASQVEEAHVWYSPDDWAVKISRALLFHRWGAMGARGYRGPDNRYSNYSYYLHWRIEEKIGHSTVFDYLPIFGPHIVRCAT